MNITGGERVNAIQDYCLSHGKWQWLLEVCARVLSRKGFPNYIDLAQDLRHTVFIKCGKVSDEKWAGVYNKDGYLYRVTRNQAEMLRVRERPDMAGTEEMLKVADRVTASSPDATERWASRIEEVYSILSFQDRIALDLLHEGYNLKQVAEKLGIPYVNLRKRLSRLGKRLRQVSEKGNKIPP